MTVKDRRTRRTRANLEDGLLALMEQKSINNITVRELTECVDVNRSTFYLHYTDIYDMVSKIEDEMINSFYEALDLDKSERSTEEDVYHFMENAIVKLQENRRKLLILCGENGDHTFIERLAELTYRQAHVWFKSILGESSDVNQVELAVSFFCSGCVALLDKWLRSENPINPKTVLKLMFQLVLEGANGFVK